MARLQEIKFIQGDDPTALITVTDDGVAFNLTGLRVEILVKATKETADADALYTLSSEGASPKITITSAAGGLATADFTDRMATSGYFWYRAYVASSADPVVNRKTFAYGPLVVDAA